VISILANIARKVDRLEYGLAGEVYTGFIGSCLATGERGTADAMRITPSCWRTPNTSCSAAQARWACSV
jgi:hypothetical protein